MKVEKASRKNRITVLKHYLRWDLQTITTLIKTVARTPAEIFLPPVFFFIIYLVRSTLSYKTSILSAASSKFKVIPYFSHEI